MTLHLVRRTLDERARACVRPGDVVVLVGVEASVPEGVRAFRLGETLSDDALVALVCEAARVVAW